MKLIRETATGKVWEMSNRLYRQADGISASDLKVVLRSPAHYWQEKHHPKPPAEIAQAAMDFGTAVHTLVLQPDLAETNIKVLPKDWNAKLKADREAREAVRVANPDAVILPHEAFDRATRLADAMRNHPTVRLLLDTDGEAEASFFSHLDDVLVKGRPDKVLAGYDCILDLKTTTDARKGVFKRRIVDGGHHISAAMYLHHVNTIDERRIIDYFWVVGEVEPPHGVMVYRATPETLSLGEKKLREAVNIYRECLLTKRWPCYTNKIHDIGVPTWTLKEENWYE